MNVNRISLAKLGLATAALLFASQAALACTTDNWSNDSGNVLASGPAGTPEIARYSGACAMQTAENTAGWVQDNSPSGIDRIVARFYVLNNLTGSSAQIYRGFSTESDSGDSGSLFTVRLAADGSVRLIDNTTSQEVTQSGNTNWLSVEIDWTRGSNGSISLSVNGQAPVVANINNGSAAPLESVRLGNLNGVSGTLSFDAYESRRSTAVGRLCVGDADGNGSIQFFDLTQLFEEISSGGTSPASGQPDVDENGDVGFFDLTQAFDLVSLGTDCGD